MLRVTPIYGSRWSEAGQAEEPECTLVEFAGCRVLWNVGWFGFHSSSSNNNNNSSPEEEEEDEKDDILLHFPAEKLPDHDCLILTDSTLQACGGLPMYYAAMKQKLDAAEAAAAASASSSAQGDTTTTTATTSFQMPPIYATYPTVKMGQMTLYDQHAAMCLDGGKPPYTLKDLDHAFAAVQCIKFSQSITVGNITHTNTNTHTTTVTAHRAGHVVGGAFFNLKRLQDETTVVLTTSTYHIARELHLDSSTLLKHAMTPDVLVTRPGGGPALRRAKALAAHHHQQKQQQRAAALPPVLVTQAENNLTEAILAVLRRDGNVLLPVDASGRVLELILLLQRTWEKQRLQGTYNLCWLGPMVHNTREFACCQLEWMASSLGHEFDAGIKAHHPFALKQVKLCTSMNEFREFMAANPNTPTCAVATGLSLEAGPARDVLVEWADNPDHAIIFTDSSQCYLRPHIVKAAAAARQKQQQDQEQQLTEESQRSEADAVQKSEVMLVSAATTSTSTAIAPEVVPATGEADDTAEDEGGGLLAGAAALDESQVSEWTTAGQLLCAWVSAKAEDREMDDSIAVDVYVPHRVPLVGAELKAFLEQEEAARLQEQAEEEKRAILREVELAKGQLRLGEDEAPTTTSTDYSSKKTASSTVLARPKKKSRFNQTLFLKFSKPLHCKFFILFGFAVSCFSLILVLEEPC